MMVKCQTNGRMKVVSVTSESSIGGKLQKDYLDIFRELSE